NSTFRRLCRPQGTSLEQDAPVQLRGDCSLGPAPWSHQATKGDMPTVDFLALASGAGAGLIGRVMATQNEEPAPRPPSWFRTEDGWAIWLGCALLLAAAAGWIARVPPPAVWHYPSELVQSLHVGPLLWMTLWLAGASAVALRTLGIP